MIRGHRPSFGMLRAHSPPCSVSPFHNQLPACTGVVDTVLAHNLPQHTWDSNTGPHAISCIAWIAQLNSTTPPPVQSPMPHATSSTTASGSSSAEPFGGKLPDAWPSKLGMAHIKRVACSAHSQDAAHLQIVELLS